MNRKKLTFEVVSIAGVLTLNTPLAAMAAVPDAADQSVLESVEETPDAEEETGWGWQEFEDEILPGTGDEQQQGEEQMLTGTRDAVINTADPVALDALSKAEKYLQTNVTNPVVNTEGGEWSVLAMARHGVLNDSTKANYLANLFQTLENNKGVLHDKKYTEYSRVVLALSSIGFNPSDVDGYNLLQPLANLKMVNWQGINGTIFALIAFDANQYEIPDLTEEQIAAGAVQATRDALIAEILSKEKNGGGWALSGTKADADMTGMALQALAPYKDRADVKPYIDRGIAKLAEMQNKDGSFGSDMSDGNGGTLESAAQVVAALAALDVSLLDDARFVKNGKNPLDEVMKFQLSDGSFRHTMNGGSNGIATDQGTYALVAWYRAVNGQTSLYDMTDVGCKNPDTGESQENIAKFKEKMNKLPKQITLKQKEDVYALKAELAQMKKFTEKAELSAELSALTAELTKQEETVQKLDKDIWDSIDPLNITLADKEKVEDMMARYNALPKENQAYVENVQDLKDADSIIKKLGNGIIGKEVFAKVKESKENYLYKGEGYTIRLKGKNEYNPADMQAGLNIKEEKNQLKFTTKADGKLPGEVEVVVDCKLKDGVYMLYQMVDGKEKAVQWTGVFGGKMTCDIAAGGEYVLKKAEVKETESTVDENSTTTKKPTGTASGARPSSGTKTTTKKTSNTIKAEVKDGIVEKKAFEEIKGSDKNLKIEGEFAKDQPYTLTINGKDVEKAEDMKAGIKVGSPYEEDIKKLADNPFVFQFEESGKFPGKLQAQITADREDGEYLLLKYNEKDRKAEYVQKVEIKDKKTKFIAAEGGTYFIAKKAKTKSVNDIEKEEKQREEAAKKEKEPEVKEAGVMAVDDSEEELLAGTKDEKGHAGVIAAVVGAFAVLAGAGGYMWWLKKERKKKGQEHE